MPTVVMPQYTPMTWIPIVDKACCCCTLVTCNKVLGWLTAIRSLITIITFCITWQMMTTCPYFLRVIYEYSCSGMFFSMMLFFFVLGGLIEFTVSIMFLIGIYQNRFGLITPFVVVQHLHVIILVNLAVWVTGFALPIITLPMLLPIALQIYIIVCANSLRLRMAEKLDECPQSHMA